MKIELQIKGYCVDDLFHILVNNGYNVTLKSTKEKDVFIIIIDEREK